MSTSITIEEAVARMINLDYIPTGFTLLEMTAAFQEEAEVEYENAQELSTGEHFSLRLRAEVCKARHNLAKSLLKHFILENFNPNNLLKLELESVADWASDKYGIGIPIYAENNAHSADAAVNVAWEEVTIKVCPDHSLILFFNNERQNISHFRLIGLMGERKNIPNKQGNILNGLSLGKKFPVGKKKGEDGVAIKRLRDALKQLTGISSDPFCPFSDKYGWKPLFKLINVEKVADERAEQRSKFESYDDTIGYDYQ